MKKKCKLWAESQHSLTGLVNISMFLKLPMWKLCVCPQISAFTTDLVLSLIIPTSPLKLRVSTNWDLTFFQPEHMPHLVNVQSALRCHDRIHFLAWSFPSQVTLFQEQSWLKQSWMKNALFQILPQTFQNVLRLSTRWIQAFSFCFVLTWHHQTCCGRYTPQWRCFCLHVERPRAPPPLLPC